MHSPLALLVLTLLSASCDGGSPSGDAKPAKSDGKTAKASDAKATDAKVADAKVADAKVADAKAADAKAADAKVADAKAADAKAADAKAADTAAAKPADDIKAAAAALPRASAPANAKDAANQLANWLDDAEKVPVPPLLDATGDIEIATHCGPCTDNPKPDIAKTTGVDLVVRRITPPAEDYVTWSIGDVKACKADCCTFPKPDGEEGSGNTTIDKICMTLAADGKPTAYTRVDAVGH